MRKRKGYHLAEKQYINRKGREEKREKQLNCYNARRASTYLLELRPSARPWKVPVDVIFKKLRVYSSCSALLCQHDAVAVGNLSCFEIHVHVRVREREKEKRTDRTGLPVCAERFLCVYTQRGQESETAAVRSRAIARTQDSSSRIVECARAHIYLARSHLWQTSFSFSLARTMTVRYHMIARQRRFSKKSFVRLVAFVFLARFAAGPIGTYFFVLRTVLEKGWILYDDK